MTETRSGREAVGEEGLTKSVEGYPTIRIGESGNAAAEPVSAPRACSQCKAVDRPIFQPGADAVHFVVPEVRYLKRGEVFQSRMTAYGWHARTFQGQPAMERHICRNCLNSNHVKDAVWGQLRDAARKLEQNSSDGWADYYQVLCQ